MSKHTDKRYAKIRSLIILAEGQGGGSQQEIEMANKALRRYSLEDILRAKAAPVIEREDQQKDDGYVPLALADNLFEWTGYAILNALIWATNPRESAKQSS